MVSRSLPFVALLALVACENAAAPGLPALQLRILVPAPGDSLYDRDTVLFVGEATADDLGPIPDDSLWWEEDGLEFGRGRSVQHMVRYGPHDYSFHARYGPRSGSASLNATVLSSVGRLRWMAPLAYAGAGVGLAMGTDGRVYALDDRNRVVALAPDGSRVWELELPFDLGGGLPAVGPDGTLYYSHYDRAIDEEGGVLAIDPSGSIEWVFYTELNAPPGSAYYHIHGSLAVDPYGTVYFGTDEIRAPLYGVNADGTLKWRVETVPADDCCRQFWGSTVLIGDSLAVAVEERGLLVAVNTDDGAIAWTDSLPGDSFGDHTPGIGDDGTMYLARRSTLYALAPSGSELWRRLLDPWMIGGCAAIGDGRIFLANDAGGVRVATVGGDPVADFGPKGEAFNSAATVGAHGVVYVVTSDRLYSYDRAGRIRFAVEPPGESNSFRGWGGPLVAPDGTIHILSSAGVVALRDTVGPSTDAPWPTFQGGPQRQGRRSP